MIHSQLLLIVILNSILLWRVIDIILVIILMRNKYNKVHYMLLFIVLTNIESMILGYFLWQFLEAVKEFHQLWFWLTTSFVDTKLTLTQHSKHWKTKEYHRSDDFGEVDLDSDVICLDSGKLCKSTTVPSQCD